MNGQIFISYRREDSAASAGRLFDRLSNYFPSNQIFMDVDSIDLGENFVKTIGEIATALKRDIQVIPVLVDGALLPQSRDLPDDLKERLEAEQRQREEKKRLEAERRATESEGAFKSPPIGERTLGCGTAREEADDTRAPGTRASCRKTSYAG